MAASIFGSLANAISPPKLKQIKYSDELNNLLNSTTNAQIGRQEADATDLAALSAAAKAAATNIEGLTAEDQALYSTLINSRVDPFQTYQQVGDYNFNILDQLSGNLAEQGRAGESRRQAALGFGGRGGSTYQSNTLLDRVTKNLAPVYANTLSGLSGAASNIDANRINQNRNVVDLISGRAGAATRSLPLYQLPIATRSQITNDQLAAILGLGQGYRQNSAGFQEKPTALGYLGQGLDSAVDTGLSLATSYAGGGSGGGMLSGIFGGGQQAAPQQQIVPQQYNPYAGVGMSYGNTPPWMMNFGWQAPARN